MGDRVRTTEEADAGYLSRAQCSKVIVSRFSTPNFTTDGGGEGGSGAAIEFVDVRIQLSRREFNRQDKSQDPTTDFLFFLWA